MIHAYQGVMPRIHPSAFVADSAHGIGDGPIGEDASVWFWMTLGRVHDVAESSR